ncbi:MAG: hypothetical protein IT332_09060 [Ardenticatenales bacterium]|nr:hypothetical protein [Ardenticatenales bacterium]
MKRLIVIGAAVFAFGMVAGTASGQVRPTPVVGYLCETSRFDENGDGLLGKSDIMLFYQRIQTASCWEAAAEGDCTQFDANKDGLVDRKDVQVRIDYFVSCVNPVGVARIRPR